VKDKGVKIYAIYTEKDLDKWSRYIHEKKLDWINVLDIYNISQYRKSYNIDRTPEIFLLDKDKKIIAKRLGGEQLKQVVFDELGIEYIAPPAKPEDDGGSSH